MIKLGPGIRNIRLGLGIRQKDLAARAGIEPPYLCAIETGQCEPSRTLVRKISKLFQLDEAELFLQALILPQDETPVDRRVLKALKVALKALKRGGIDGLAGRGESATHRKRGRTV